jgi:hypothetical protein
MGSAGYQRKNYLISLKTRKQLSIGVTFLFHALSPNIQQLLMIFCRLILNRCTTHRICHQSIDLSVFIRCSTRWSAHAAPRSLKLRPQKGVLFSREFRATFCTRLWSVLRKCLSLYGLRHLICTSLNCAFLSATC